MVNKNVLPRWMNALVLVSVLKSVEDELCLFSFFSFCGALVFVILCEKEVRFL